MSLSTRNGLLGSPGFGLRGNVVPLRGKKYPTCLYDGNTVAWYDSSDLTTIVKDSGDYVSRWNDKLGSGRDLIQATAGKQPKWMATDGVLFDGVNDFMKTNTLTFNKPQNIYLVLKITSNDHTRYILSGAADSLELNLRTSPRTPHIDISSNGIAGYNATDSGIFNIIRVKLKGANSYIKVNHTFTAKGTDTNINASKITIASLYDGSSFYCLNAQYKELIFRNIDDTVNDDISIYNYLAKKHGFDLI